jgi:hypothetical protein
VNTSSKPCLLALLDDMASVLHLLALALGVADVRDVLLQHHPSQTILPSDLEFGPLERLIVF